MTRQLLLMAAALEDTLGDECFRSVAKAVCVLLSVFGGVR